MKILIVCVLVINCISIFSFALPTENKELYIQPDQIGSLDIVLPDSLGVLPKGRVEYKLLMEPFEGTWADLTERKHYSDENNTIIDVVRFSTAGKKVGECSTPFKLTISANMPGIPSKMITGFACVSNQQDVDSQQAGQQGQYADDVNLFDIALDQDVIYAQGQKTVPVVLLLQSYENITIDLSIEGIQADKNKVALTFDEQNPFRRVVFNAVPPAQDSEFEISASIRGCMADFCTKYISGNIITSAQVQQEGFTMDAFPHNIDLESPEPVQYTVTIDNIGGQKTVFLSLKAPQGLDTDFASQSITLEPDSTQTVTFSALPKEGSKLYQLELTAAQRLTQGQPITKKATAYISTNELYTDALRQLEGLDSESSQQAGQLIDEWNQTQSLDGYVSLREKLDQAKAEQQPPKTEVNGTSDMPAVQQKADPLQLIVPIIIVAAIGAGAAAYFVYRRKKNVDDSF